MNKIVALLIFLFLYISTSFLFARMNVGEDNKNEESRIIKLQESSRVQDSLALFSLYDATNGAGWVNPWVLQQPMYTWEGVVLNPDGCVTGLYLYDRNLSGEIPSEIGNLANLSVLDLSNNQLVGGIPPEIGNLTNLTTLDLSINPLLGEIPSEIGSLVNLSVLYLSGDQLKGAIPPEIGNLINLSILDLSINQLEGEIPLSFRNLVNLETLDLERNQLSAVPFELNELVNLDTFFISDNKLTFEDLIPIMDFINNLPRSLYEPQDSIFIDSLISVLPCDTLIVDLAVDAGISGNVYNWYQNGTPFQTIQGVNRFSFSPVHTNDAGIYSVEVTNPQAPLLILYSRPITLTADCPVIADTLSITDCAGSTYTVGNNTYSSTGIYDHTLSLVCGCDSLVTLDLTILPPSITILDTTVCQGESIMVFGQLFDNSVSYDILGPGLAINGCDSSVFLSLSVLAPTVFNTAEEICEGESYSFFGQVYAQTGVYQDTLLNGNMYGCDSIGILDLTVNPYARDTLVEEICDDEMFELNGQSYHLPGFYLDTLMGSALNGCDSILLLNLTVNPTFSYVRDTTLCPGQLYPAPIMGLTPEGCKITTAFNITEVVGQADAGEDQVACTSSIQLDASLPMQNGVSGRWESINFAVVIVSSENPQSAVTDLYPGANSFIWTISHPACPEYDSDTVVVSYLSLPDADAGGDFTVCQPTAQLDALMFGNPISGKWISNPPNLVFSDRMDPFAEIAGLVPGESRLTWTLSHPDCPDYSSDEVVIFYEEGVIEAEDDVYNYSAGVLQGNILNNDLFPNAGDVEVTIVEDPGNDQDAGELQLDAQGNFSFSLPNPAVVASRRFRYRVEHKSCPELFDEATIRINLNGNSNSAMEESVSLVFTPNGDGVNDVFIIPELAENPQDFPYNSLVVMNRWGDVVYWAKPYNNDWDGTHYKTKKRLPPGTYFYIARLSIVEGIVRAERVTLIR